MYSHQSDSQNSFWCLNQKPFVYQQNDNLLRLSLTSLWSWNLIIQPRLSTIFNCKCNHRVRNILERNLLSKRHLWPNYWLHMVPQGAKWKIWMKSTVWLHSILLFILLQSRWKVVSINAETSVLFKTWIGRDDSPVYFVLCGETYLNFIYSRLAEFGHNQSLLWGVNQQELAISALPTR